MLLGIEDLRVAFRISKQNGVAQRFEAVGRGTTGVSFEIAENSTLALVGESGSGKSVTAMSILNLLPDNAERRGTITFQGRDMLAMKMSELQQVRGKEIACVFQDPMTSLNPVFTVGQQICEPLTKHLGLSARAAMKRAEALLVEVGMPEPTRRLAAYPHQLSGGQQQRVMIAMAIACEPKLLIADEPTTALDVTIQKQIIDLIDALRKKRQMSVLFITHDLALVGEIADSVIVMRNGEVREKGEIHQIFEAPKDPYTKALLRCRPSLDSRPMRLPVIADYLEGNGEPAIVHEQRARGLTGSEAIVLDVRNLSKSFYTRAGLFGKKEFKAVKDVSFKLARGKTLGVVGESGSGKTTVGLTLLRLHQASSGQALFDGKDILSMSSHEFMAYKRRIQIIFQNPYASLNPRFTVGQILIEPMRIHAIGRDDRERAEMAFVLLKKVGLPEAAFHRYPHEFSGGQRQRIAIARCLTMKPEVLVCDESVSALDVSVQAQVLNLLQDLQEEFGMSYIFISHDLAVVKYIADQVMVMNQGSVVELANSDELYRNPQHAYTRTLLNAIPKGLKN